MAPLTDVRLTVIGPQKSLRRLDRTNWTRRLNAKHIDVWEHSRTRRVWWFQTESDRTHEIVPKLSMRFPRLIFFVDYEASHLRLKGLAKVVRGRIEHCCFSYAPTRH
jgi:hypothetical protein